MDYKEDDVVMCTIKSIEGATVFVELKDGTKGSIVMSEVAAGRIRNIRDYIIIGKTVFCKILKVSKDHLELSLRRVTGTEKEEMKDRHEKERNLFNMLKVSVKKYEEVLNKIKESYDAKDFLEEARANPSLVEKFIPKAEVVAFTKILLEKKEKDKEVKTKITIKSISPSGIKDIKSVLEETKNVEISYLGSSKFSISAKGKDFKEANQKIQNAIDKIKSKVKEKKLIFESEEK